MWGKEVSATLVRKETKKRRKKTYLTYVPANEAMATAGLARLEGRGTVERWGFEDPACGGKRYRRRGGSRAPRRGCSRPSCVGCGGDPRVVVADVVATPRRRAVKDER